MKNRSRALAGASRLAVVAITLVVGAGALTRPSPALSAPHVAADSSAALDRQTEAVLEALASGRMLEASTLARQLATTFPLFGLGQLLHAELESMVALSGVQVADNSLYEQPLIDLLLEARTRLEQSGARARAETTEPSTSMDAAASGSRQPAEIIQLGRALTDLVVVDLASSSLYQYKVQNGRPGLTREHYIASGRAGYGKQREGDLKTPLGVYRIQGFRSDASLPDLYGSGALTLNYPNALDRFLGRTGSGIWLHGVPSRTRSRAPRSSEGCVTMSNDYLTDLTVSIDPGRTMVLLTHDIVWVTAADLAGEQQRFRTLFEHYRDAWVQENLADLVALYSQDALPEQLRAALGAESSLRRVGAHITDTFGTRSGLEQLAGIDASTVSIVRTPSLSASDSTAYVMMDIGDSGHGSPGITLYWALGPDGQWRIERERTGST